MAEAEQMLWEELLWTSKAEDRFWMELKQLVDDVTFTQRGMSFVTQRNNGLNNKLA